MLLTQIISTLNLRLSYLKIRLLKARHSQKLRKNSLLAGHIIDLLPVWVMLVAVSLIHHTWEALIDGRR